MSILTEIYGAGRERIRELIGRVSYVYRWLWRDRHRYQSTTDETVPDFEFYDKARRGLVKGLEISGLFLKPINSKVASWVLGRAPRWSLVGNEYSEQRINEWWDAHHTQILPAYEDSVALGNNFIVVNPDLSVTIISPEVVDPIIDPEDYSKTIGWRITQRHDHPSEIGKYMIITNEYTAKKRVRTVEWSDRDIKKVETFPNLIGRVPVIHVPNNRGTNERWGRPECEALISSQNGALHRYGEILDAGLDGNLHQGRPTPTIKFPDVASLTKFKQLMGNTERETLSDGSTREYTEFDFDSDKLLTVVGDFSYEQPGAFANETKILTGILFWLIVQHTEIPEFALGVALDSSKASAETQMPPFIKWIEKKRMELGWMAELADVVLRIMSLSDARVRVAEDVKPMPVWDDLVDEDETLTFEVIKWAFAEGLLDEQTALELSPAEIADVPGVLKKAREERKKKQADQQKEIDFQQARDNLLQQQNQQDAQDNQDGKAAA